ncbi:MAG: alkaline phosphatase PhoX [Acidimicrobiales bacterium]
MDRRTFLRSALAGAGAIALGDALRVAATATAAGNADHPSYGSLQAADANGLEYPLGFSGRLIARSGLPVGLTPHLWPAFPDGAACFERPGGKPGWILVVNSENPPAADLNLLPPVQNLVGGASAIVFDGSGKIKDSYWVLRNTQTNCAGGVTPWGTWLSCEEFDFTVRTPGAAPSDAGRVWECFPTDKGGKNARVLPQLGHFKHEAATFDDDGRVYLTEDMTDGCFYRFTPSASTSGPASLTNGVMDALRDNGDETVTWVGPIDPTASSERTRVQAALLGATIFNSGEGCYYDKANRRVLFTTKGDNRVWDLGLDHDTLSVLYDGQEEGSVLTGVDNIIVSPDTGNIYVAEDGGNMEVVVIERINGDWTAAPLVRATGPQHGIVTPSPVPTASEITGLALSPDGTRLYFNGQRSFGLGVTYEVTKASGRF